MDVDSPETSQKALEFCKQGDHMGLLWWIYSGLIKVNSKANSLAIKRLCEEMEPDIDVDKSDSSMSDDMTKMLTWEDGQMDVDYPIYELMNQEYEYVPWNQEGGVEEISNDQVDQM